ncbi:hypothetical protein M407DRAFT_241766 [Tulasnella calospora MUT 4182]|uniref:Uncharacterized protein n=1 Tax=Tulasnella calospora MUT 4182 TaxID=1051891 RepID=A0A0C3MCN1_9AGAM|nr:hypothetical protein M407DRAFT_241766 [Tulasnella calospora MUT 4182]
MGDDVYKPSATAAVVILFVVAVWVRARALFNRGTSRAAAPSSRWRLNTTVEFVPFSGVQVQPANDGGQDTQAHQVQAHPHLRRVDSVTSLRYPSDYPVHHLDDGVTYGYSNIGNLVRSAVDIVLGPRPDPPSHTTNPGEHRLPL